MSKNRMEAFSDGVLAIVITIMVLELSAPKEPALAALEDLVPTFLSYILIEKLFRHGANSFNIELFQK